MKELTFAVNASEYTVEWNNHRELAYVRCQGVLEFELDQHSHRAVPCFDWRESNEQRVVVSRLLEGSNFAQVAKMLHEASKKERKR